MLSHSIDNQTVSIQYSSIEPKWRNWQTRYVQGVEGSRGFELHLRHDLIESSAARTACVGPFRFEIQFTNAIMTRIIGDGMIDANIS